MKEDLKLQITKQNYQISRVLRRERKYDETITLIKEENIRV